MPLRNCEFNNGDIFHVYNRGTDKRSIFLDKKDIDRFLFILKDFNEDDSVGGIYHKQVRIQTISNRGLRFPHNV